MTVFYVVLIVTIIGLVLACLYPNSRRERIGWISFGVGLFFVLKYLAAVALHYHWS